MKFTVTVLLSATTPCAIVAREVRTLQLRLAPLARNGYRLVPRRTHKLYAAASAIAAGHALR